jgi:hypothetical protein
MTLSEFEEKKYEKIMKDYVEKHRPPVHLRNEVDLSFLVKGQSVELFEIRPLWDDKTKNIEVAVAKATYVKSQKIWRVYWCIRHSKPAVICRCSRLVQI